MRADGGQVDGSLYAGVAASGHGYPFAGVEGAVAVCAECHAVAYVVGFAGHRETPPAGSGGDDQRTAAEGLAGARYLFDVAGDVGGGHLAVLKQIYRICGEVGPEVGSQPRAGGLRHGNEIFNTHGLAHLAADGFGYHGGVEPLAGTVYRRSRAGWTSSKHRHIIFAHGGGCGAFCAVERLEFCQQVAQGGAAHA